MTHQVFQNDGVDFACLDQGAGSPLVLIHGFPLDHTMWQAQIDTFCRTNRVIAPDLRGFGRSGLSAADVAQGVEMRRYAADVVAMLDRLQVDEPAILCGFSMGGYVLWQLALQFSERVRAIVLCDTRAEADSREASEARLQMADEVMVSGTKPVAEAMLPKLLAAGTLADRPDVVDRVNRMICSASPEAIAGAQRGMARRPDVRQHLANIQQPALVIVGAEDAISSPEEMRGIAEALPRAQFEQISGAGHLSPLEKPDAVSDAIRSFVERL